jgi:hypothetical protein
MGLWLVAGERFAADDTLRTAIASFHRGAADRNGRDAKAHFRRSADQFAKLRRHGFDNAALCRNEGNAALLSGDLPGAIVAYRHGLRLSPGDRKLRANLAYARSQVTDAEADGRRRAAVWPPWLPWPSLQTGLGLLFLAYAATCVAWTRWWMARRPRILKTTIVCYLVTIAMLIVVTAEACRLHDEDTHPLVVVARDGILLRRGNGVSYPPRRDTLLSRGVEARLLYDRDAWLQVQLSGGEVGWLPRADVVVNELNARQR